MNLTKAQRHELNQLLANAGIDPRGLKWRRAAGQLPKEYNNDDSLPHGEQLYDPQTANSFTIGSIQNDRRSLLSVPGDFSVSESRSAEKFEKVKLYFQTWLTLNLRDRKELIEWPNKSRASSIRTKLTLQELNHIGATLNEKFKKRGHSLDDFTCQLNGENAEITFQPQPQFKLSLNRSLNRISGVIHPASDRSFKHFQIDNFTGFKKIIQEWLTALERDIAIPDEPPLPVMDDPQISPLAFSLARIELTNIRGFRHFIWEPNDGDQRSLLIIGPNGTGKSTLLRSVVLALLPQPQAQALLTSSPLARLLSSGTDKGSIRVDLRTQDAISTFKVTITKAEDGSEVISGAPTKKGGGQLAPRVHAYGSGRAVDGTVNSQEDPKVRAVLTLFRYNVPLVDPDSLLLRLEESEQEQICQDFAEAMGLPSGSRIRLGSNRKIEVVEGEKVYPLPNWADGFRLTLQWVLDLWYSSHLFSGRHRPRTDPFGLLILDEVDLHLHPLLQARLIKSITELFPNLFCLCTTHSPVVTLGVDRKHLVVLRKEEGEIVQAPVPSLKGYTVEDILMDDNLFATSPYPPEKIEDLDKWRSMMETPPDQMTDSDRVEFEKLTQKLLTE